jgi:hypothetical protein
MENEPCRLLSDAQSAVNLPRRNTVLAVCEHPHGGKPLLQRDGRVLEDRPQFDAKLPSAITALKPLLGLEVVRLFSETGGALWAIGPAHLGYRVNADLLIREVLDCLLECLWLFHDPTLANYLGLVKDIITVSRNFLAKYVFQRT